MRRLAWKNSGRRGMTPGATGKKLLRRLVIVVVVAGQEQLVGE